MKLRTRLGALSLCIVLIMALVPAAAFAQDGPVHFIGGTIPDQSSQPKDAAGKALLTGGALTGFTKKLYDKIAAVIPDIAAGARASTVISCTLGDLGLQESYDAEALGVSKIIEFSGDQAFFTDEVYAALNELFGCDLDTLIDCLLTDFPYDLYWYDKTEITRTSGVQFGSEWFTQDASDAVLELSGTYDIYLPVMPDYSNDQLTGLEVDNHMEYMRVTTDTAKTAAASGVLVKAQQIVDKYASASDYEKVLGYKNEICALTEYNMYANEHSAELPYITIPLKDPEWRSQCSYPVSIWYRSTSNLAPIQKADEILAAIHDGIRLPFDGGLLVLRIDTDTPTQIMTENDYRSAHLSLLLNAYHLPGV